MQDVAGESWNAAILRHLALQPHGNNLLTSSAAFWLLSARVLVLAMATAECVAWGYLGYLFGEGATRWIGAAFAGTIIFLVVWMIDISLITMDRAWHEHSARILDPDYRSADRKSSSLGRQLRTGFTFLVRIGLLIGSLYITAPYLSQVVFHKDIDRFINQEATANLDAARKQMAAKLDAAIAEKSKEITEKTTALNREVAGKGLSGRYGMGPAAIELSDEIDKLREERGQAYEDKDSSLSKYDELARDWRTNRDRLAAEYNVVLPAPSILENQKALQELERRPEYRGTELAIRAFLAFIFAGLFLLKLFEPESVHLYFSDVLQQEYLRYLAGTFDRFLPETEKSTFRPSSMTPQRLYQFLATTWVQKWRLLEQEDRQVAHKAISDRSLRDLEQMRGQISQELADSRAVYLTAQSQCDAAKESLTNLNSAIDIVESDIRDYEGQLGRWDKEETQRSFDEQTRFELAGLKAGMREKLTKARRTLESLNENKPAEEEKARRAKKEFDQAEQRVKDQEAELADVTGRIREVRQLTSEAAGTQVRSALKTG
jgi:hypothetical protein